LLGKARRKYRGTMLKLFPITNANRKWVAAFGENWGGGVGTAKVGWLVG